MDLGIKGRRAIICAGSKGLGRATAFSLAREGVDLVLFARTQSTLDATADEIRRETGVRVDTVAGDVATEEGRAAVLRECPDPDILVNNPGGRQIPGDFRTFSRDEWLRWIDAQMLSAMAHDLERGTGPWQAELLALPQAFLLAHGAVSQARFIAEGLVVDAARMRRNLDATQGLIVSEAVMMGLAPVFGRGEAHHIVNDACDLAIAEGIGLTEALLRDARVAAKLDAAAIAKMTDPAAYLGSAGAFVDRVLARARSAGVS